MTFVGHNQRFPGLPRLLIAVLGAVYLASLTVAADVPLPNDGDPPRQADESAPVANALKVEGEPTIDGDVLGDAAYAAAPVITGFVQTRPDDGQPASQRTEIRVVYTATTLFVGVVCYDSDPASIIVAETRRDADLEESDSFRMLLDTFNDDQNGFVFGTNPAGIEYDAQVDNDGQGNFVRAGQGGGSIGGFNINWDGSWTVATAITESAWTAEFAIPLQNPPLPADQ